MTTAFEKENVDLIFSDKKCNYHSTEYKFWNIRRGNRPFQQTSGVV
jgi:hypothetical protein